VFHSVCTCVVILNPPQQQQQQQHQSAAATLRHALVRAAAAAAFNKPYIFTNKRLNPTLYQPTSKRHTFQLISPNVTLFKSFHT
jgi:hypothetical protein